MKEPKKVLEYYGGEGWGFSYENGNYQVKHGGKEVDFKKLSKAKKYYESINDEKCCWNLTVGFPVLLEAHVWGTGEPYDPTDLPF